MMPDRLSQGRPRDPGAIVQPPPIRTSASREVLPLVMADLQARSDKGLETYGTRLMSHNGRDALQDAYEEALDLACYLRQAMMEREKAE